MVWDDKRRSAKILEERVGGEMAKFKLGNEMKGGRYWEGKEKKRCKICNGEKETWEHV